MCPSNRKRQEGYKEHGESRMDGVWRKRPPGRPHHNDCRTECDAGSHGKNAGSI